MKKVIKKIRPAAGYSHAVYIALNAFLPILVLILVRFNFAPIAAILVLLAKWRTFAVRPRYWLPNIRGNLVDVFVGLSVVAFMAGTETLYTQLIWTVLYIAWLVWLKPKSKPIPVMAQALIAQVLALIAFNSTFTDQSIVVGVIVTWVICYAVARHFLGAFDESLVRPMSQIWAWFGAMMAWVLGHWVIEYLLVPQIALVLTVVGYGLATMYYLKSVDKLKPIIRQQLIGVLALLLLIIIVFSDWQDKTV